MSKLTIEFREIDESDVDAIKEFLNDQGLLPNVWVVSR